MTVSLSTALYSLTNDRLNAYAALLTSEKKPTLKAELVKLIERQLTASLNELWNQLDEIDKLAVSETLYSSDGEFDTVRFKAKHGKLPAAVGWYGGYREKPPLLRLFLYSAPYGLTIPEGISCALKQFVPKPVPFQIETAVEISDCFEQVEKRYKWQDGHEEITVLSRNGTYQIPPKQPKVTIATNQIPITRREMELGAQQDLQTVLRLIAKGKVAVSDKTFRVSTTTAKEIATLLRDGDFYEITEKKMKWEQEIGPIRAFSWPLLVQAARLAQVQGKKLALTKSGLNALNEPAADTLRLIWQRWVKSTILDEFQRIDEIKGQSGKGGRSMSALEGRRSAIALALAKCPVDQWLKLDEFSRFMQAAGIHFEVTHNPWSLYISDPNYGSLGNQGSLDWSILQGRYIRCFLFEYAATLGVIDVAYIPPEEADCDYHDLWGADDLAFLSRYDGLLYFRLNPLGAYCLGISSQYVPRKIQARAKVSVLPSLQISVLEEALSPESALLLDTYAEQESPSVWRLARNKALAAVEEGHQIAELREFLQSCDEQPLPETVEAFISNTERQARALRSMGMALLIECANEDIAEAVAKHRCTKHLCQRAGAKNLVVLASAEEQFRKALNILGYGMPKI
jgi:hypothetical protein